MPPASLSTEVPIMPAAPLPPVPVATIKYAGFWLRAAALLIDGVVMGVIQIVLAILLGSSILGKLLAVLAGWIYMVGMVTKYQATLGKMAVGLRVQGINGEKISLGRACLREILGKLLCAVTLGIGYLIVAWTEKKQGLHDKIADTVVIEVDPNKSKTGWVVLGIITVLIAAIVPIIGIFSAVTLSALNAARLKGSDAIVRSELSTLRVQAELYFDAHGNSYLGYCVSPDAVAALEAASSAGTADKNTMSHACNDSATAYAASAPLRTEGYSCVDSTGASADAVIAEPLPNGETVCASPTPSIY